MSKNKTVISNDFHGMSIKKESNQNSQNYKPHNRQKKQVMQNEVTAEIDSPLLFASKEIFKETHKLMNQESVTDLQGISNLMSKEIDNFSNVAMAQGVSSEDVHVARYILTTFIDEMFSSSNWSNDSDWANVSLLGRYFSEGYGGANFFQLLKTFESNPTRFIHLMELAYVCLSFGFGGMYKQEGNSLQDLNAIKENLYRQIKTTRPKKEKFYANHPAAQRHHKLYSKLSRKLILAVSLLLMLVIYTVFTYTISNNETTLINTLKEEHQKMGRENG